MKNELFVTAGKSREVSKPKEKLRSGNTIST